MTSQPPGQIDIYARVSRKGDRELRSTAGQVESCRAVLAERGLPEGKVHIDDGRSAWRPGVKREGWDDLMGRLESGEAAGVIVFDLERFARQPAEGERLIEAARRGLTVLDSDAEFDLASASGKKSFRDAMAAAAYYSDRLSDRVKRGKARKAARGEVSTRRAFGFEPDGHRIREDEAVILRELTTRFLADETLQALTADLNSRGILSSQGKPWTPDGVRLLLLRPRNAGHLVHHGVVVGRLPAGPPAHRDCPSGCDEPAHVTYGPPIIDPAAFDLVVAKFAARRPGRPNSPKYLCSGVARCGRCGGKLAGRPRVNMLPYPDGEPKREYNCNPSSYGGCGRIVVDQRGLDLAAGALAVAILSDRKNAQAINQAAAKTASEAALLDAEIAEAERTAKAIGDRLGRGEIDLARHDAIVSPLDERLAGLRAKREGLDDPGRPVPVLSAASWQRRWDAAEPGERRALLAMALRGRPLVVGPADPADRSNVTRRLSVGPVA